ncbi:MULTISPECIES: hypothetical protein [unclassified Nonomuraea]|uniref:hypothetical protein n=1 Tax=unclassified Nonomuraea TaxID=2593643 RepID=UPI0033D6DB28
MTAPDLYPPDIVSVAVGFTVNPNSTADGAMFLNDPTKGLLGTGTLGGTAFHVSVTDDIRKISIRRGASRADSPLIRYEATTGAIVLDNSGRKYDPTNLAGPYVSGGVTQVEPMRPIIVSAIWDGVDYPLATTYTDSWDIDWAGPNWSEATAAFTDAFRVLEEDKRQAVAAVGSGETSGARIHRILDSVGWPADKRAIDPGDVTLQATTLEGPALTELQAVADAELGALYIRGDGVLVFQERTAVMTDPRSTTSQATFGDGGGSELPYKDGGLGLSYDTATLINRVIAQREGGTEVMVEDLASQEKYLVHSPVSASDLLLETDSAVSDWATYLLTVSRAPELRFTSMEVWPRVDPERLWPQVLGREIGDRITVIRRPPGGGDPIVRDVIIRGIEHEITPDNWVTRWTFQPATKFAFLVLNADPGGRLDQNALAF